MPSRFDAIPIDAVKITEQTDMHPPKSETEEYGHPWPLSAPINTAGAEDSAFVLPDGSALYFFFTPDVRVPVEKQLFDNVTGIWVSKKEGEGWGEPERAWLQYDGKLALDGCEFVLGSRMWFCSAREGYEGMHWFTADFAGGEWGNYQNADFEPSYEVGELHISRDGRELFFHSAREGGMGGLDIWLSEKLQDGSWGEPQNLAAVNTERDEGWPYLSQDGSELWFSHDYGVWRSKRANGSWQEPFLMFSGLAGEPTLDESGNVYFTHHFFGENGMIEADIYSAKKTQKTQ